MVWESIKKFFDARTITSPGKVSGLLLIVALAVAARYSDNHKNSRRYFVCNTNQPNKSFIEAECYDKYGQEYGDTFPPDAFVGFWSFLVAALLVYTVFASRHVLVVEHHRDDLNQMPQNRRRKMESSCSVFVLYIIQLVLRVATLVVFTYLQLTLRPMSFPATYKCPLNSPVDCKDNFYKENKILNWVTVGLSATVFIASLIELLLLITKCCLNRRRYRNLQFICFLLDVDETERQQATLHLLEEDRQTTQQLPSTQGTCQHLLEEDQETIHQLSSPQATRHLLKEDRQIIHQVPSTQGYDYTELTEKLKRKFLATTENLEEIYGKTLKTDTIFTKLLLQKGQHEHSLDFEKRTENLLSYTGDASTNVIEQAYQLFTPGEDHANPKLIFITGRAGIGKTMFSTKLVRDWASGTLFPHEEINNKYKFVFLFFFRQLNEIRKKLSLFDFLSLSHELDTNEFEFVCKNPEQILIVMDGLDEFKNEVHIDRLAPRQDKQSIATIFSQLLNRSVLNGATVVVTSRPERKQLIKFDRKAEILGFKQNDVEDYFKRFFGSRVENANLALGHVKENANIAGLCYVPVNCFIICMYFEWHLENPDSRIKEYKLPSTITELYQGILEMFTLKHHKLYKGQKYSDTPDVTPVLEELSKLSFELLKAKKYVFNQNDLRKAMGDKGIPKVIESGLIHAIPGCRTGPFSVATKLCFIHLTFQEYLAALYLVKMKNGYVFIKNAIYKNLDVVIQFVSGLLKTASPSDKPHELLSSIIEKLILKKRFLLAINCMFEFGSPSFAKQVVQQYDFTTYLKLRVNDSDCAALAFLLSLDVEANRKTKLLDLSISSMTCVGLRYVMDALESPNCCIGGLRLFSCDIGAQGAKYVSEALSSGHCTLQSLDVSANDLGAEGAKYVSEALTSGHCTLQSLDVSINKIDAEGAKYVSKALSSGHCTLQSLYVCYNRIGDEGAKYVSKALSSGHCTLQSLYVSHNRIGDEGAKYISEALSSGHCTLQSLDVSDNKIGAEGAKYVSESLSSGHCTTNVKHLPQ